MKVTRFYMPRTSFLLLRPGPEITRIFVLPFFFLGEEKRGLGDFDVSLSLPE